MPYRCRRSSVGWRGLVVSVSRRWVRTFNCGIGMIAVVKPEEANGLIAALAEAEEFAVVIGTLQPRGDDAVTFTGGLGL